MEHIIHFSQISHSQEDLLRGTPFVATNETPPENSSLPSSRGRRLDHCAVGQVFSFNQDVLGFFDLLDSQGSECVDLGRDSNLGLGFAEIQLNQRGNAECVAESSSRGTVSGDNGISMLKNMGSDFDALKSLQENYQSDDDDDDDGLENNAANELESVEGEKKKKKISAFDVLKSLTKIEEDNLENGCLLEDLKLYGLTLSRPRWWQDNGFFKKQKLA